MGGCRCTFRNCENGTASRKELHYFRYPIRDPERLKEWIQLANREEFLNLPKDKLGNKVVCQEHFERRMFMNYLCDRLTRFAVPRLMRQSDGTVLNLKTGNIQLNEDDNDTVELTGDLLKLYTPASQREQIKFETVQTLDSWKESSPEPAPKKIKILNSETLVPGKSDTACKLIRISTTPTQNERHIQVTRVPGYRAAFQLKSKSAKMIQKIEPTSDSDSHTYLEAQDDSNDPDEPQSEKPLSTNPDGDQDLSRSTVCVQVPAQTPVVDPLLAEKMERNSNEIMELKQMVKELLDRPPPKPQPITMVAPPAAPQKVVMAKGPHLTKAQLFSSIKRYLNPTMVTLLRMELFSGPSERQWKPDEKSLAVDLLNIGENVYDHFTEEFRFRLPPKADAQEWKAAGELDADDAC
ncbi:AGAP004377-PA-like protein [Anopheles sinensis]|uniref:AGAP004377-PA-like protein n=1 Tax=Anopheles sinensis TaxID=74873 RepID=A0A084WTH3_ANOSI|nr:AGAP004377-PA-like protein [Anopheles sinensis]